MRNRIQIAVQWLGRAGLGFLVFLAVYAALSVWAPQSGFALAAKVGTLVTGLWLAVRLFRWAARVAVWRLRNRLLVTYLFISVLPIVLVLGLAGLAAYSLASQLAVSFVTRELDQRIESVSMIREMLQRTDRKGRSELIERMGTLYEPRFPGLAIVWRDSGKEIRFPSHAPVQAPGLGWTERRGVLVHSGTLYLWSYAKVDGGDLTVTVPLTRQALASLVPNLGIVNISEAPNAASGKRKLQVSRMDESSSNISMPPPVNRFDTEVLWFATLPVDDWELPKGGADPIFLAVRTRLSAVFLAIFNRKADLGQGLLQILLLAGVVVFLIVEVISIVIGTTMTRTITGAVHGLYEATQRVAQGDFSHRIQVKGRDQLAELGRSFNQMNENLERLVVVAKEKERLQSEIEIAREVQGQLFPRSVPELSTLRIHALCRPARLVSGDYYDYELVTDSKLALAVADVAGKGISAALLMAALQSSLRAQLQSTIEAPVAVDVGQVSTSNLVSRLNRQIFLATAPEKYATFFLGVYDQPSSTFSYTNAGHLPPLLVRDGVVERLEVNGTVVGAFPSSQYSESHLELCRSDVLLLYTDGITEPENAYGEMFGEQRLADLLSRNAHRSDQQLVESIVEAVQEWTGAGEQQDDITLLVVRRV